ncbi:hypothetical protein UCH007_07210 [Dehalococcoides sp. UCH007]|nr:hypothetical protein UCH007_07210 [Dehalococcoides sp. UCH007]
MIAAGIGEMPPNDTPMLLAADNVVSEQSARFWRLSSNVRINLYKAILFELPLTSYSALQKPIGKSGFLK